MILKEFSLQGKTAIIAGAGRSWLPTLASCLAEAGADVAFTGQDTKQMKDATEAVKKYGRRTMTIRANLTKKDQVETMAAKLNAEWGKIDILVNAMDLQFAKPLLETTAAEWQKVMDTNLNAVFVTTKAVGKYMNDRKYGKVVTLSSGLGERGIPYGATYCASKGAICQFTRALGLEWIKQNITVNAIGLGWMSEKEVEPQDSPIGQYAPILVRYIAARRLGKGEDLDGALVYLTSEASVYVTGQTFYVTGGVMAHG
jgi:NAD(P)-dependent dehydrogenase (short-subunit alcohol dehydrogenase family)